MTLDQGRSAKVEIQVIDDKLLAEGINTANADTGGVGEVNLVEMAPSALKLTMSFKNIGRIENLVGFDKLEKLCLDNNLIEEIINLSHLKCLKWLDLSFNKIRRIQGLDQLKKLEDLSLYCNKISVVEGLEYCTNLQCLSLGNNRIDSLDQVIRLRPIRSLKMLTLANNPIENNPDYRVTVLAYIDSLHYLDYAMIDKKEKSIAKDQFHDELLDVEEKESIANEQVTKDKAVELYLHQLDNACILFAYTSFEDLFYEDMDVERLKHLPNIKDHVETFRSQFKILSEDFITKSLERFEKKSLEISEFDKIITQLRIHDDAESTKLIDNYTNMKKVAISAINIASHTESLNLMKKLQEDLDEVNFISFTLIIHVFCILMFIKYKPQQRY